MGKGDGNFLKARQEAKKGELDEQLKEYINEWRKQRAKEEEELKRLKEKQAKRKEIRAEQEKKLAQQKKKRRRRKRRKNKCFLTDLLRPSDNSPSHVLHLKTSITSTSPLLPTHPKQQKTISFHESFVKVSDLVSNRLETSGLASKQNIDS